MEELDACLQKAQWKTVSIFQLPEASCIPWLQAHSSTIKTVAQTKRPAGHKDSFELKATENSRCKKSSLPSSICLKAGHKFSL